MKVLSVRQPWAGLIIEAGKDVENRTWFTAYKGPLLIHASQRPDQNAFHFFDTPEGRELSGLKELPPICNSYGFILGQVNLVAVQSPNGRMVSEWHDPDQYAWMLHSPLRFTEAIRCKGQLKLFDAPANVAAQVNRLLHELHA